MIGPDFDAENQMLRGDYWAHDREPFDFEGERADRAADEWVKEDGDDDSTG